MNINTNTDTQQTSISNKVPELAFQLQSTSHMTPPTAICVPEALAPLIDTQMTKTIPLSMLHLEYDDSGAVGSNSWKLLFLLIAAIKYLVCQPSNCVISKKDINAHSVQVDMCQGANGQS